MKMKGKEGKEYTCGLHAAFRVYVVGWQQQQQKKKSCRIGDDEIIPCAEVGKKKVKSRVVRDGKCKMVSLWNMTVVRM